MKMENDNPGLEALFDNDLLLVGRDVDDGMMLDMTEEFLQGMETPIMNINHFDMNEPSVEPTKSVSDFNAMKMITYLQEQLNEKEKEIENLKRKYGDQKDCSTKRNKPQLLTKNLNDNFELMIEQAVAAIPEEEWNNLEEPSELNRRKRTISEIIEHENMSSISQKICNTSNKNNKRSKRIKARKLKLDDPIDENNATQKPMKIKTTTTTTTTSVTTTKKKKTNNKSVEKESFVGRIKKEKQQLTINTSILNTRDINSTNTPPVTTKKVARRWTSEQDEELRVAVATHNGQNWKAIAKMVRDRDHVQCLQRWKKVLQPGLVKGMWSKEEDNLLLGLMKTCQPKNWADIAAKIPGRTAKQCRERWSLNLDPSINRGAWTEKEDNLLIELHKKLGNRWAEIKRHLNGRTENGVKTRFKSLERAQAKDLEVVWTPELEAQLHDICVRFDCRIDEVAKHLPRALRGISAKAMRLHCPLLKEKSP